MENYVQLLIEKVESRLGPAASLIATLGKEIKVSIEEGDLKAVQARIHEAREAAGSLTLVCDHFDMALSDGSLSATEIGGGALLLSSLLDQMEDVVTGVDEDDSPLPVEP